MKENENFLRILSNQSVLYFFYERLEPKSLRTQCINGPLFTNEQYFLTSRSYIV